MNYYRIDLPYACYTIQVKAGRLAHVPPIAKWAYGKKLVDFEKWVVGKGGSIKPMEEEFCNMCHNPETNCRCGNE